jgi:hypothetical protein
MSYHMSCGTVYINKLNTCALCRRWTQKKVYKQTSI